MEQTKKQKSNSKLKLGQDVDASQIETWTKEWKENNVKLAPRAACQRVYLLVIMCNIVFK